MRSVKRSLKFKGFLSSFSIFNTFQTLPKDSIFARYCNCFNKGQVLPLTMPIKKLVIKITIKKYSQTIHIICDVFVFEF